MAKLSAYIVLTSPDNKSVTLAPGDELPDWAKDQVSDAVLEKEAPAPRAARKTAEEKPAEPKPAEAKEA